MYLHLEVMEQLVLFESLCGTGARKGRRKWKKEQVGAVGEDVCDLPKAFCSALLGGSAGIESNLAVLSEVALIL